MLYAALMMSWCRMTESERLVLPVTQMTSTPRRFVIEDGDDHDRFRVVVCTINLHIVCLDRWCTTVGNRNDSHPESARQLTARRSRCEGGMPGRRIWGSNGCNRDGSCWK